MTQRHWLTALIALPLLLQGLPAHAGAPGSADRTAALPNICGDGPRRGQACDPTDPEPCGVRPRGRPFACIVDVFGAPKLQGTLTLAADESVGDNTTSGGSPTVTMVLEIMRSDRTYFLTKTFQNQTGGIWPEIGPWVVTMNESDVKTVTASLQFSTGALADIGAALHAVGEEVLGRPLGGAVPVLFALEPSAPLVERVDQFEGTDLGQAARYDVLVRFMEPAAP